MFETVLRGFVLAVALMVPAAVQAADAADAIHWVDVRSAQEYADGHVEGAVNIPHTEIAERIAEVTTDKDAALYLYCRSGRRSGLAMAELEAAGFTNVHNIGGLKDAQNKAQSLGH